MNDSREVIEIGLELVKLLMPGKEPCKHSAALWEVALKLLNVPPEIKVLRHE